MASIDPVVLAVGTIREVTKNEFVDRSSGMVEDKGRKVTLLTRAGFLQFNVPLAFKDVIFRDGDPCAVWVRLRAWQFNGREGVTLIFDSVADPDLAAALVQDEDAA